MLAARTGARIAAPEDATVWQPRPEPEPTRDGQESVWDYPRPAVAEPTSLLVEAVFGGAVVASTRRAVRTLETSHPPSYYFPVEDVRAECLVANRAAGSTCEWKGGARYWDVVVGDRRAEAAAWSYPSPTGAFLILQDHIAFYPGAMDECRVDGEVARAQEGGFYGGWISSHVAGPFKGPPGTRGW